MKIVKTFFLGALCLSQTVLADNPRWMEKEMPFDQLLNMETVYNITHTAPDKLVAAINAVGVAVLRVPSENPTKSLNSNFAGIPVASPELIKKAGFQETYEGRMIDSGNPCCQLKQDTILIRDTALNYTLVHEFLHSQLKAKSGQHNDALEDQFAMAFRRLTFYQKRIYDNSFQMQSPLWRRDMLAAQNEVADMLTARIQIGQSQEAIIEKVLARYIDQNNPLYDAERQKQGLKYGEVMINNAIDMFNALHESVTFNKDTVKNLRDAIVSGDLKVSGSDRLTDADAADYAKQSETILKKMDPAKEKILAIKQFFQN